LNSLRTALLWLHVLAAVLWIGSSTCIAIAAVFVSSNPEDAHDFNGALPRLNRLSLIAAIIVGLAGLLSFLLLAAVRRYRFSPGFTAILALKVILFMLMFSLLAAAVRSAGSQSVGRTKPISRIAFNYATAAALGILAMGLGIWLAGV
jgi:uncharacterized membrane protein